MKKTRYLMMIAQSARVKFTRIYMTFRLLIQKPPSLSNERLLGTSFDCQLSYYTAENATLKVSILTGVIIDMGEKCLRPKFTMQTKDNARSSCCFEIVPAFLIE